MLKLLLLSVLFMVMGGFDIDVAVDSFDYTTTDTSN